MQRYAEEQNAEEQLTINILPKYQTELSFGYIRNFCDRFGIFFYSGSKVSFRQIVSQQKVLVYWLNTGYLIL